MIASLDQCLLWASVFFVATRLRQVAGNLFSEEAASLSLLIQFHSASWTKLDPGIVDALRTEEVAVLALENLRLDQDFLADGTLEIVAIFELLQLLVAGHVEGPGGIRCVCHLYLLEPTFVSCHSHFRFSKFEVGFFVFFVFVTFFDVAFRPDFRK